MKNVSDKCYKKNQNTHFVFNYFFFNRAVYEIMWKNNVEPGRRQMTMWRMRIACWIPKAANTHSEYVILITFPLRQKLHELISVLRKTHIACIVVALYRL
jgi:hypothetical protein